MEHALIGTCLGLASDLYNAAANNWRAWLACFAVTAVPVFMALAWGRFVAEGRGR